MLRLDAVVFRETWNSSYVLESSHYRFQCTRLLEQLNKTLQTIDVKNGQGEITFTPPAGGSYVLQCAT